MNDSSHRATTIHPAVRVGHVHLKVSDLERSLRFYRDALGLTVTADGRPAGPPAVFLAAGDYHSHIALNTFESEGATPPPPGHTGLYHVALLSRPARAGACSQAAGSAQRRHRPCQRPRRDGFGVSPRSGRQRDRAVLRPAARDVAGARRRARPPRRSDPARGDHRHPIMNGLPRLGAGELEASTGNESRPDGQRDLGRRIEELIHQQHAKGT
jgi:catechol 2,3-dioxygenase-like lactoylglutathione lyase family enzyme